MRRSWFILLMPLLLLLQAVPLAAQWQKNLALLELQRPWLDRHELQPTSDCYAVGKFPDIKRRLQSSLALNPTDDRILTHMGRIYWLEGDCDTAAAMWKQAAVGQDPSAAFELFQIGMYDALPSHLRLVLADYAYRRAVELAANLEAPTALQWFRRALELVPQHRSAEALARWYEKEGDTSHVVELWQKMADQLPSTDAEYWWAKGRLHALNSEWEAAAHAYEQGGRLTLDPYEYWIEAGRAWENDGNWEQATEVYERARVAQPEFVASYIGLGNIYRLQKQYDEALKWYESARRVYPEYADPIYYLGLTQYLMLDHTQAQSNLQKAVKLNPDHISAMYYLAQSLHETGNLPLAESWLVNAIDRLEYPPSIWWEQLGDWRLEQHHCTEAHEAYIRAGAAGTAEQAIQQKLEALSKTCGPR